ncbi:hypothetical protein FWK35_00002358, partial [Aphis craccivora]
SERSDEFLVSDSKMNLVGAFRRSFFEFPNSFQKRREKKIKEKPLYYNRFILVLSIYNY